MSQIGETQPQPRFMRIARDLYGAAFDVNSPVEIAEAAADWSHLSDAQRSFTLAHMLYLNLQAQALIARQLAGLKETFEEAADDVSELRDRVRARDRARHEPPPDSEQEPVRSQEQPDPVASSARGEGDSSKGGAPNPSDVPEADGLTPLAALFKTHNTDAQEVIYADR